MLERITIITGESSGELYGALLAEALKSKYPNIKISGTGGERMKAAGVELVAGITGAFGGLEALKHLREIKKTFRCAIAHISESKPQLVVLIDYPSFNLRLSGEVRKLGIPALYYVSPHVWAWRKWRINTIKKNSNLIALTLPFEEQIYRDAGIPCRFVGHPALDEIRRELKRFGYDEKNVGEPGPRAAARRKIGLDESGMVITVMPGSRRQEIQALLPVISDVMKQTLRRYPGCRFVLPAAPNLDESVFESIALPKECLILKGEAIKALMASDSAVIASGTSTLQAALLGVPMVVIYKLPSLSFFIAKKMVKLNFFSLVNLLLEKSVQVETGLRVKELVQEDVNAENIVAELVRLQEDFAYKSEFIEQLKRVKALFSGRHASQNVVSIISEMAGAGLDCG